MSSLKIIREKFGITQSEIAQWLGVSRSLAEHYENGIRGLPTPALLQLAKLEIIVADFEKKIMDRKENRDKLNPAYHNDGSKKPAEEINSPVENHLPLHPAVAMELDMIQQLEDKLAFFENNLSALKQQKDLVEALAFKNDGPSNEKEKLWLQMLHHGLVSKMCKYDETKQLSLRAKILQIKFKHELIKKDMDSDQQRFNQLLQAKP